MSALANSVSTRRFPSNPSYGTSLRASSGRIGIKGAPYQAMDRFSVLLMWASALYVAVMLTMINWEIVVPWVLLGAPISIGFACMISKMVNRLSVTRVIAITYAVSLILGTLLLIGV